MQLTAIDFQMNMPKVSKKIKLQNNFQLHGAIIKNDVISTIMTAIRRSVINANNEETGGGSPFPDHFAQAFKFNELRIFSECKFSEMK